MAQTSPTPHPAASSSISSAYLFVGLSGFIPFNQAYHLNYSTKVAGLPIELSGGLGFPLDSMKWVPLTVRYIRREATYVTNLYISTVSIEPGYRAYFEHSRPNEPRFFGGIEALLVRSTVSATIDASNDGATLASQAAQHDYYNYGVGFDIGLSYQVAENGWLDGGVHLGIFLGDRISKGGLGDIGGVSITAAYRIAF